jgi:hypothetical protein
LDVFNLSSLLTAEGYNLSPILAASIAIVLAVTIPKYAGIRPISKGGPSSRGFQSLIEVASLIRFFTGSGISVQKAIDLACHHAHSTPLSRHLKQILVTSIRSNVPLSYALCEAAANSKHAGESDLYHILELSLSRGVPARDHLAQLESRNKEALSRYLKRTAARLQMKLFLPLALCIFPAAIILMAGPIVIASAEWMS